jgi:sulfhydrogenase subunit alpha
MTRTIVVNELARVEGHGGIEVEMKGDEVANVKFNVFEGQRLLETLLNGRSCTDVAPTISRICAICSAAHFVTSLQATEAAFGTRVTAQTALLRELLFRGENIESHALHIFLLAAPDYLGYPGATDMAKDYPQVVKLGLELKQLGNALQEVIGGRAVQPVNPVLGGFARLPSVEQLVDLRDRLAAAVARVPMLLDFVAALPAERGCQADTVFVALAPEQYGYAGPADVVFLEATKRTAFKPSDYRMFTNEQAIKHSNAKHSSYRNQPYMVGALARLTVNGERLAGPAAERMKQIGLMLPSADPLDNNKAQAIELVYDLEWCLHTIQGFLDHGIRQETPVAVLPRAGTGTSITEAPRGLLVHSYTYNEAGRIVAADIITPTAMNAASVERHFRYAVEQSPDKSDAVLTRRLEMIARAYDPCISCSVHMVRLKRDAG